MTALWNGLVHDERKPGRAAQILEQAERLKAGGAHVFPQVSPRPIDVHVNWSGGMAFYSLPPWHELVRAALGRKRMLLADLAWRERARTGWDAASRSMIRHRELDKILFTAVAEPTLRSWVGKTLADLVAERGGHPSDVLADWVALNDLAPGVAGLGVANADSAGIAELLKHPTTVVSASDAGAHVQMMCAGDTTLLLTRHVRDRSDLALEDAIKELTGRQAQLLNLSGRGIVSVGATADLVVFDPAALVWERETPVWDLPGGGWRSAHAAGRRCRRQAQVEAGPQAVQELANGLHHLRFVLSAPIQRGGVVVGTPIRTRPDPGQANNAQLRHVHEPTTNETTGDAHPASTITTNSTPPREVNCTKFDSKKRGLTWGDGLTCPVAQRDGANDGGNVTALRSRTCPQPPGS